ncbi:GDSL-like Lipase/Acylhydrolase [Fuerstiella marisgermanici]|uniref:GDSL-like Lipase/Acylhydrolase n=2 Tax=Fuerstiella marisgermanici TaxID=1891926 RepID=A0A1P8WPC4_9PLAN|nr:GDSL-like Lipase/Acylhydrolase [Fuerstiella marisgermanici]
MMKKYMCLALLVICFAFSHALGDDAFPLKAKRVLFLGDSITNAGHYVSDIETQLRLQVISPLPEIINIGLSSETCSGLSEPDHPFPRPDVHERLDRALDKARPDVVVACYGMNDGIYYPFSEERFAAYKAGVRKLVNKVHTSGAKIVLMTPPPFDPSPLKGKEGKLLPAGAEKYAWFAIYENYDDVIQRYAEWVMQNDAGADMVVNVHQPISDFLKEQRERDPGFSMANDGVHMDARGHRVMAKAILNAWGLDSWKEPSPELQKLVQQRERVLHAAWLSHIGHKRPGVKEGLPLADAVANAAELDAKITPLVPAGK